MARVLCALSGGVDSSVAALLLRRAGHEVTGVFMRNGIGESSEASAAAAKKSCCSASDAHDAARVAEKLGLPFYAIDYAEEFGRIVDGFVTDYRAGRTPSPCVLCNQDLKFGHLLELATALGCEAVATGHYARCETDASGTPQLRRARDRDKDQSYFLFGIDRAELGRVRFPLGHLSKGEVRDLAREAGFATADKPESMEICFVPGGDYRALLAERGALTPGRFVDREGHELGRHLGYEGYTVGQRRGLPALGSPHYVLEIRPKSAEVVLGTREELGCREARIEGLRWLVDAPTPGESLEARVQIRARHEAAAATLRCGAGDLLVSFRAPQDAVTPGQAAVLYDGDQVLGGGWIAFPAQSG